MRAAAPALLAAGALLLAPLLRAGAPAELTRAAAEWLASLEDEQREEALYSFADDERFDLRLAPIWLEGLRRDDMTEAQWQAWLGVLSTVLSETGLAKVETIMSLEREVGMRDQESLLGRWFGGLAHGEKRYYVALFGEPRAGAPWGFRFDGHHLSLNWTVSADGALSLTPVFLGGEPREVSAGWERAGLRVLAEEEDRALALWQALDAEQRASSELEFNYASGPGGGNRPLFLGQGERVDASAPVGIPRSSLAPPQQALLDAVVDTYLSNYAPALRDARRAAIDRAGRDALHFAWAGSLERGQAGYYRVQGPTLLIEYDNTMRSADHVHTLVREFDGDFGRDLLAEHYAHHHGDTLADGL